MTKRLTIALVAVVLFVLMAVMPVSATGLFANGTVINQGATIFIGEEGLNVTHAMNQARFPNSVTPVGYPDADQDLLTLAGAYGPSTAIGWWASAADLYVTSPSRMIDLGVNKRYVLMSVAPADFVGYTGNWYLLNGDRTRPYWPDMSGQSSQVFNVQDPTLDIKIWDFNQNNDVTGKSVPQGEKLGFRIDTNMYPALDGRYRTNKVSDIPPFTEWAPTGSKVMVVATGSSLGYNNAMIDATGYWDNQTLETEDPIMPCCRPHIFIPVEMYYNYTSFGAWMTWSNGNYGCNKWTYGPFYFNETTHTFKDNYGRGADLASLPAPSVDNLCGLFDKTVPATDGYINLKIKDEANAQLNALLNHSASDANYPGPYSVLKNFVNNQPFFWGSQLNIDGIQMGKVWDTGALDGFNQYAYPVGTYTISAESILNKMKDNYKQGGADYTGKTVSASYTITLVSDTVKIEANKDSVVRSKSFSVTVTGRPSTSYNLWVKGTSSMDGTYDNQPPMIVLAQEKVRLDGVSGWTNGTWLPNAYYPAYTGMYVYENGAGLTISDDVSVNANTWNGTRCYANITTSTSGTRTIEFLTTNWTKAQKYTIRVEQLFGANYKNDEVDVKVEKGAVTIVAAGDQSYYLGRRDQVLRYQHRDLPDLPVHRWTQPEGKGFTDPEPRPTAL